LRGASDNRSESLKRSGTGSESLLGSRYSSRLLLSWLIELGYELRPVFRCSIVCIVSSIL
jgi:hypothetical protein